MNTPLNGNPYCSMGLLPSWYIQKLFFRLHLMSSRGNKDGFVFLFCRAAMNNHANVVSYVGAMSIEFVNETTDNSQTALVLAVQRGHINVVEKLLDLKADITISDDSDRTVLHYATAYPDILKLLLKVNQTVALVVLELQSWT